MPTIDDLDKRVRLLEQRVGVVEADHTDIPGVVTMHFDLLRAEMRALERRLETKIADSERRLEARLEAKIDTKIDEAIRVISELIVEQARKP